MNLTALFMKVALLGAEWVLWLLLLLSALSIAIAIEKAVYFHRSRINLPAIGTQLQKILHDHGTEEGKRFLSDYLSSPQVRIVLAGLEENPGTRESIENAMTARKTMEKIRMERHLGFLSTLGNNAPFLGLLGTVLGIMGAFYKLHLNISGGTNVVMKDISEALVATAAGLFVALPAVIFTNIFRQKIKKILAEATVLSAVFFNYIESRAQKQREIDVD